MPTKSVISLTNVPINPSTIPTTAPRIPSTILPSCFRILSVNPDTPSNIPSMIVN